MNIEDERMQIFPLAIGILMGGLSSEATKEYLLAREVSAEQIEAAYSSVMVIASAFYREPK